LHQLSKNSDVEVDTDMTEQNSNESAPSATDCFCDLAPLYALGVLGEAEQRWVEQQIADNPELAAELAQYQSAVTAMPYGVDSLPSIDEMQVLKGKLFARLDLDQPTIVPPQTAIPPAASSSVPLFALRSDGLKWHSPGIPKVEVALLYHDRVKREKTGLLRAAPDMHYPPHRHGGVEEIYMLSGDLMLEGVTYYAGDYIRSAAGSDHAAAYSAEGCMFFFRNSVDDQYPKTVVFRYLRELAKRWVRGA
jgi:anti-sigma factor ChrR (cupin superfamily)